MAVDKGGKRIHRLDRWHGELPGNLGQQLQDPPVPRRGARDRCDQRQHDHDRVGLNTGSGAPVSSKRLYNVTAFTFGRTNNLDDPYADVDATPSFDLGSLKG